MTKRYNLQVLSGFLVIGGSFLVLEHLLVWGGFDLIFGHEWIGLILIALGFITGIFTREKKDEM